jgi:uncharacterized membrane protein YfcA
VPEISATDLLAFVALFIAASLGGALNAVAGGGTFITLPTLIFTGVPPVFANTTSTMALWPGSLSSVFAYRREIGQVRHLGKLAVPSIVGGLAGAVLLVRTPEDTFVALVPWLLLGATLLFTYGSHLTRRLRDTFEMGSTADGHGVRGVIVVGALQIVIAVYGGYFGGGIGILMLASFVLMGMENIHEMNALKTILASCINGVAVLTFVVTGKVLWLQASVMIAGGVSGGYFGAHFAQQVPGARVRQFVTAIASTMTFYFFVRNYILN